MISIVVCSKQVDVSASYKQNIAETIGCDYELIVIDNLSGSSSICQAYNNGIKNASFDIICFQHDDILHHTKNWGIVIKQLYEADKNLGLIGVAGSKSKTRMPSGWWNCPNNHVVRNIIQHFPTGEIKMMQNGFDELNDVEVSVIDGVFMVMKKNSSIEFNENIDGFHNYDLNVSFEHSIFQKKIIVSNKILIEHFSIGKMNKSWCQSAMIVHELYSSFLPTSVDQRYNFKKQEVNNGIFFTEELLKYFMFKSCFILWSRLLLLKPFSKFHFRFVKLICVTFIKKYF